MSFLKDSKGQIVVVMTLAIATLLGAMSLSADVGIMYYNHMLLQKGADAAAIAGANYLNQTATGESLASSNINCSGDDATKAACTYAVNNNLAYDSKSLTINENVAGTPNPNIQVVATRRNLPYMFGRVIGLTTYNVAAVAHGDPGKHRCDNQLVSDGSPMQSSVQHG